MPPMLVKGQNAEDVAAYVGQVAAKSGVDTGALATAVQATVPNTPAAGKSVFTGVGGCGSCHTMGSNGKLGYTERGKQVGKGFIGCVSLLTSMNLIAQVEPANRTPDEKAKALKFREFGCTTCHQIIPGKMGLTSYGTRLKSFHMACTDVERILSQESKR